MEILPKCINRNRAVLICVSDECTHPNPFICANCINNQCRQMHRNCINPEWANIKNRIEQSKKLNHPNFKLSSVVEQTIQKSIKYLQKQLQYFSVWKSTFGMPTDAINLIKSIQNNQEHKLTGKQVAQILKDAKTEIEIKKYNESTIKQQMKEVLKKMEQTQKMIREMYSVWEIPQLSLKIKQYNLEKMNKRLTNLSEKPTDLELKVSRMEFSVLKSIFKSVHFNIIIVGTFHIISDVIINQLIRVNFNIISDSTYQYQYQYRGHYQLIVQTVVINKQIRVHLNINTGSTFPYYFSRNYQVIDQLIQFAQSLKNPNLKSLKTLSLYYPYAFLGNNSEWINYEKQISSSLLTLPQLKSVTIIANDIKSLDGFKSLGNKLNASKDKGWCERQEWQK